MNRLIKISLVIAVVAIGASACELVVPVELPDQEPKLTLNALVAVDSMVYVQATQSKTMVSGDDNKDFPPLPDATIDLYEGDQKIETLMYDASVERYMATTHLSPKTTYTLKASAPGLDPVEASTTIPEQRAIDNVTLERNAKTVDGEARAHLSFEFQDPGNEENYYKVLITLRDQFGGEYRTCFYTKDLSINGNIDGLEIETDQQFCDIVSFDDQLFDGKKKTIDLYINEQILSNGIDRVTLYLVNVNRDMALYEQSSVLQQNNQGNPFAEPVFVYNNVIGGFGIFGAFNLTREFMDL